MLSHQYAARRRAPLTGHCHAQPHALHHLRWVRCGCVIWVGSGVRITITIFSKVDIMQTNMHNIAHMSSRECV